MGVSRSHFIGVSMVVGLACHVILKFYFISFLFYLFM